jgi:hypothetical protein
MERISDIFGIRTMRSALDHKLRAASGATWPARGHCGRHPFSTLANIIHSCASANNSQFAQVRSVWHR